MNNRDLVCLVLGGGVARGLAHLGVLKVFEKENIPIDIIVGTSVGSLIGAVHCLGGSIDRAIERAEKIGWNDLLDIGVSRLGLARGQGLANVIDDVIEGKDFKDLKKPLYIVASDIEYAQEVVFSKIDSGKVKMADAIRGSCSLPGVFTPPRIYNKLVVDGGVINSVPVSVAKKLNAGFIIAVDAGFCVKKEPINNVFQMLMQIIQIAGESLNRYQSVGADFLIKPDLDNIDQTAFERSSYIIQQGRVAAQTAIPKLKEKLEKFMNKNRGKLDGR